jgi:hypothetical protein
MIASDSFISIGWMALSMLSGPSSFFASINSSPADQEADNNNITCARNRTIKL